MRLLYVSCLFLGSLVYAGNVPADMSVQSEIQGIYIGETEEQIRTNRSESTRLKKEQKVLNKQLQRQRARSRALEGRLKASNRKYEAVSRDFNHLSRLNKLAIRKNNALQKKVVRTEAAVLLLQEKIKLLRLENARQQQRRKSLQRREQDANSLKRRQKKLIGKISQN